MKTRHLVAVTVVLICAFVFAVSVPSAGLYSGRVKRTIGDGSDTGDNDGGGLCQACGIRVPSDGLEDYCANISNVCGANGMTICTIEPDGTCTLSGNGCHGSCSS
jgi:hypothetical protein